MKKKRVNLDNCTTVDPKTLAQFAGLRYVTDNKPGIQRENKGKDFIYRDSKGVLIDDEEEIKRIHALAIPPAYTNVWICPHANGHIQATARDSKGRKQYRYHKRWREVSDEAKYHKVIAFANALPAIRAKVKKDLSSTGMPKEKVLATVVYLLEVTLIRVGNEEYAKDNQSFGLTTFRNRHVDVNGSRISFKFRGKSKQNHSISLSDRRLAKIIKRCKDLPGQDLFEYLDENNQPVSVTSTDVNDYLQTITEDHFTAKDFRTWAGTMLAVFALQEFLQFDTEVQAKKNIVQAIEKVAKRLGNTPSVCRKCYIHPEVFNAYLNGALVQIVKEKVEKQLVEDLNELSAEEAAVLAFLKQRLEIELKKATQS